MIRRGRLFFVAVGLCASSASAAAPTLMNIVLEKDDLSASSSGFNDWSAVLSNPLQYTRDPQGIPCPPGTDLDCSVGTPGRDLLGFAWTYDGTPEVPARTGHPGYVYVYLERYGSPTNAMNFFFIMDVRAGANDGTDPDIAYLSCQDKVLLVKYQGSNGSTVVDICNYEPAHAATCPADTSSDPLNCNQPSGCVNWKGTTVAYGSVDGFSAPGRIGTCTTIANAYGGDIGGGPLDGLRFEARVPWSNLGVPAGTNIIWHVSSKNNADWAGQADDNLGDPQGGVGSFSFVDFSFTSPEEGGALSPGWVSYAHVAENTGNVTTAVNVKATSSLGLEVRFYEDPDADGDPTTGAQRQIAIDANGDGDFSDPSDVPPAASDDVDSDDVPDAGRLLSPTEVVGFSVELIVPPGLRNATDTTVITANASAEPGVRRTLRDTTLIGTITLGPVARPYGAADDVVNITQYVRNNTTDTETVNLSSLSARGWTITLYENCHDNGDPTGCSVTSTSGPLAPNAQYSFIVQVAIPNGTSVATVDTVTVTGTVVSSATSVSIAHTLTTAARLSVSPPGRTVSSGFPNTLLLAHELQNAASQATTVRFSNARNGASTCPNPLLVRVWSDPDGDGSIADGMLLWQSGVVDTPSPVLAANGGTLDVVVELIAGSEALPCTERNDVTATAQNGGATVTMNEIVQFKRIGTYRDLLYSQATLAFSICDTIYTQGAGLTPDTTGSYTLTYRDSTNAAVRTIGIATDTRGEAYDQYAIPAASNTGSWTLALAGTPSETLSVLVEASGALSDLATTEPAYALNATNDLNFVVLLRNNNTLAPWTSTSLRYVIRNDAGTRYLDTSRVWQNAVTNELASEYTGEVGAYDVGQGQSVAAAATAGDVTFESNGTHRLVVGWRLSCGHSVAQATTTFNVTDCTDLDNDGYGDGPDCAGVDCDDTSTACHTNCSTYYLDQDDDGHGVGSTSVSRCAQPSGYVASSDDCDDTDADEYPGQLWYPDADGDTYGDSTSTPNGCERLDPTDVLDDSDCDDTAATGAACFAACTTFYADQDGDGHGIGSTSVSRCAQPSGYVASSDDCDDTDDDEYPGQLWYPDADGDTYGDPTATPNGCERLGPTDVLDDSDCDDTKLHCTTDCSDTDSDGYCAGNDCDDTAATGATCFAACATFYADQDGDGSGDANSPVTRCGPSAGTVTDGADCNDANAHCTTDCTDADSDGRCVPADCDDGSVTGATCFEGCATFYRDLDGDGYGDDTVGVTTCTAPSDFLPAGGDCDDTNRFVHTGLFERCDDGLDNDCDGAADDADAQSCPPGCADLDGDGFRATSCGGSDCDDQNPFTHPAAGENCFDGIDDNCDSAVDGLDPTCSDGCMDADGDGYAGALCGGLDCDDDQPAVYPGAVEHCSDGLDNDCNGLNDALDQGGCALTCADGDGDGYADRGCGGGDCRDDSDTVSPGSVEICNGSDDDCDGRIDETPEGSAVCDDRRELALAGGGSLVGGCAATPGASWVVVTTLILGLRARRRRQSD